MPKKTKQQREKEGWLADALRWEFIRRDPQYRHDYARWKELSQVVETEPAIQIPDPKKPHVRLEDRTMISRGALAYYLIESLGNLEQKYKTLRREMIAKYRLLEIADPNKEASDFSPYPLPTSTPVLDVHIPNDYTDNKKKRLPPPLRVLENGRLTVHINMFWSKEDIMDHLEEAVDQTLKAMKGANWIEEKRRRLKEWEAYLEVYDLRKQGKPFLEISEIVSDNRINFLDEDAVRKCHYRAVDMIEKGGHRKIR